MRAAIPIGPFARAGASICMASLADPNGAGGLMRVAYARLGLAEIMAGLANWRIWHLIGSGELRRRYARSRVGQFWVTLSTGLSILILGLVWSALWNVEPVKLLPHLTVSIIIWQFMASIITESIDIFPAHKHILLSQYLACSTVVFAMVYKNALILLHNVVIIALVFIVFQQPVTVKIFLVVPAVLLFLITALWLGYLVGLICARFRDIGHAMQSILQLGFYITPVIWKPEFITEQYRWLLAFNPFATYITIIRGALTSEPFPAFEWGLAALIAFGGAALSLPLIGKYRRRLLFWV